MKQFIVTGLSGAVLLGLGGCQEQLPTATDESMIPVEARTVEVRLPFSEFAGNVRSFGGFGSPAEVGRGYVARDFDGVLNANTLIRFSPFPGAVTVRDTAGVSQTDSVLTFPEARLVVRFDTITLQGAPEATLSAGALLTPWHGGSATWDFAVDTLGDRQEWETPGGGPVRFVDQAEWDPAEGDSVVMTVDSATVAEWQDTSHVARGVRLSMETENARVRVRSAVLRVDARPSVRPDTIVTLDVGMDRLTFIYDPAPEPVEGEFQIGGVPAWRTVFDLDLPESLDGPPEVCAAATCPIPLTPEAIVFASLVLQLTPTEQAFRPVDAFFLDVRPVLSPERLPRSPLGSSLLQAPRELAAELFDDEIPETVGIPMTPFVQAALRGGADQATPTLALLSALEPTALNYATFAGPGSPGEPYLRIILTLTDEVQLP